VGVPTRINCTKLMSDAWTPADGKFKWRRALHLLRPYDTVCVVRYGPDRTKDFVRTCLHKFKYTA